MRRLDDPQSGLTQGIEVFHDWAGQTGTASALCYGVQPVDKIWHLVMSLADTFNVRGYPVPGAGEDTTPPVITWWYKKPTPELAGGFHRALASFQGSIEWEFVRWDLLHGEPHLGWSIMPARIREVQAANRIRGQFEAERVLRDSDPQFGIRANAEMLLLGRHMKHCKETGCIFGRPVPKATVDRSWLAWNSGTITHLASAIHEDREPHSGCLDSNRMAILADAVEEAGCTEASILTHLRSKGPHVRGCFVIDAMRAEMAE